MGRSVLAIVTECRHGSGLILRYLDAAWADCVVSVESGAAHFCALQGVNFLVSSGLFNSIPEW
jgi:hypothetical protein